MSFTWEPEQQLLVADPDAGLGGGDVLAELHDPAAGLGAVLGGGDVLAVHSVSLFHGDLMGTRTAVCTGPGSCPSC